MASSEIAQRNQDATIYVGNIDEKVHDEVLWELMLQVGPVVNVHIPKDKISQKHAGYGFVEFRTEDDAEYAIKVMNMVKLYGKPIKVNKSSLGDKSQEIGANIFIGNLDPSVDEKLLYDTFSAFGGIMQTPKIMRGEDGASKGFGFVSFDSFEASDLSIECMNGQFLYNRVIMVQYAYKKESPGERHGSMAERMLAQQLPQRFKPHVYFSSGDGDLAAPPPQQQQMYDPMMGLAAMGGMPMYNMPPPPPAAGAFLPPPPPAAAAFMPPPPPPSTAMFAPPPPPI